MGSATNAMPLAAPKLSRCPVHSFLWSDVAYESPMSRTSDFINAFGYVLALCALAVVGLNVRKTYVSINRAQGRVAGVEKLVLGRSKIRAGKYFYVPFRIDDAMECAHIVGKFHTAGGPDKIVQLVVAEQKQFGKWADGQSVQPIYSIERTTNAKLDLPIPQGGDYYLGFSNISSTSDKTVFGDIELRFSTR